jgi:sensory rhodopsin
MLDITTWFTLGTLGMVAGTIGLGYGATKLPTADRRPFLLVVLVPGIAAVAYGLMTLGIGGIDTPGGTVYVPRYVDWLLTTPLNVTYIALLAGAGTKLLGKLNALMGGTIVFGLLGALLAPPLSFLLFAAGGLCFVGVLYLLYGEVTRITDEGTERHEDLIRKLRLFITVLWLIYPVIWLLAPAGFGLMDLETTSLVVSYIDVVAKVGFGLIAFNDLRLIDAQTKAPETTLETAD